MEDFAADVVELLDRLGVDRADVFGWSMGAAVALRLGTDHAGRVGRLVLASVSFDDDGVHPGLLDGIQDLRPEHLHGSEFHEEYLRTAPDPAGWPSLVTKIEASWTRDLPRVAAPTQIRALAAPDHAGAGRLGHHPAGARRARCSGCSAAAVAGDLTGLPACRLAILPGTTHTTHPAARRAGWPR